MQDSRRDRIPGPRAAPGWVGVALLLAACAGTSAAPFAGTLQQLSVKRGARVAPGAPLFALERENETAARREAAERLAAAEARLANLQTGKRPPEVEAVVEQLKQARAARELSAANFKRQQQLFVSKFVSAAVVDDARAQLKRDEAHVAELAAAVEATKLPARADEIRAAEADARAAREVLAQSDWRLGQRAVAAPAAALVHDTYYTVGDYVPAGSPVVSLLPPGNVKARFYVAEPMLAQIRPGQDVKLSCDGCDLPITATVDYVSNRAEFTPPVLYSKENRAKLVFLVEARPAAADAAKLKPGQPVDVALP
jgi:HlyD family secretion protein